MRSRPLALVLMGLASLWAAAARAQERGTGPRAAVTPSSRAPAAARAMPEGPGSSEKQLITMDFQDVEIGVLVKFISEITGKNFILDEKVRGKVTVISPTKISIEEAYRVSELLFPEIGLGIPHQRLPTSFGHSQVFSGGGHGGNLRVVSGSGS